MYRILQLETELKELNNKIKAGEACQAIIDRIVKIQMELDNLYCYEF